MRYFATPSGLLVRDAMRKGHIGMINTPAQASRVEDVHDWVADNGCFGKGYPGDVEYLRWLTEMRPLAYICRFAVAPDVVADAEATLKRSAPFLPIIRALGYRVALAAQDGLEHLPVPWETFDVLFLGGSTTWKLGRHARELTAEAKARSVWVHMGRVNSQRRLEYAAAIGCDSADGTYLARGPDTNLPNVLAWLRKVNDQQPLWRTA